MYVRMCVCGWVSLFQGAVLLLLNRSVPNTLWSLSHLMCFAHQWVGGRYHKQQWRNLGKMNSTDIRDQKPTEWYIPLNSAMHAISKVLCCSRTKQLGRQWLRRQCTLTSEHFHLIWLCMYMRTYFCWRHVNDIHDAAILCQPDTPCGGAGQWNE